MYVQFYCGLATPAPITPGSVNTNRRAWLILVDAVVEHAAASFTSTKLMFRVTLFESTKCTVPVQSTLTKYVPVRFLFRGEVDADTSVTRLPPPSATKRPSREKGVPSVPVTPLVNAPPVVVVTVVVPPVPVPPVPAAIPVPPDGVNMPSAITPKFPNSEAL